MSVTKQFVRYVTQNIFGMLGISCYIIADTFFIAKAAGTDGITVLNLVLPIYNLIFAIGSMIGVGSATRFTILRAQGEERAHDYFSNAICFVWMIGILFTLAGIFIPDKIIALMGGDAGIVALGTGYTRIFLLFTPFFMMNYVIMAFVRNDNQPSLAMAGTLAGSFSNILFDYIFMFPLGMGLEGAALATAASPIISILICSAHFLGKKNTVQFRLHAPSIAQLFGACQLGVPAFVGEISSGVITTVFNFLMLGLVGNIGVAAYGVIANFALVAMAIFNGVSQGAQPIVSDCYGKGDVKSVRKIRNLGLAAALGIAVVLIGAVFAGTFCYIGHLVKKRGRRGVAHGDTVCQSSEHGKVVVAVAEGIGVLFVYLVIIKHIVKTGGFGVAERNEFAEIAAPVNALKIAVTCGTETGKLLGVLKP